MEIIVVLGIFALLAIAVLPLSLNYYQNELLNKTANQLAWALKDARDLAVNQNDGTYFGVYIGDKQFTIFNGANYDQRIIADDIIFSFPDSINIAGAREIIFAPNTGTTEQAGAISLSRNQVKKNISINSLGIIDY